MMRIAMRAAAITAITLGAFGPVAARAECKMLEIAEFHVDPQSRSPLVDGAINGKAVKVLFDTGSFSMIPRHEADRLGLILKRTSNKAYGIGGDSDVYTAQIKQLSIGKFAASGMELPVAGDQDVAWDASIVLGDDFFSQVDTEFDLPENMVRLFKPEGCAPGQLVYWGAAYSQAPMLAWQRDTPAIRTMAVVNGKRVMAELDTGSFSSLIDTVAAGAAGVERASEAGDIHGAGRYQRESWIGRVATFSLGDETVNNVRLRATDLHSDMSYMTTGSKLPQRLDDAPSLLVGADFFRAHRIYIDARDHLILFSYSGGPVFRPEDEAPAQPAASAPSAPPASNPSR